MDANSRDIDAVDQDPTSHGIDLLILLIRL
jgi:hypothetical protein